MIVEPLNIALEKYSNINGILKLYNSKFIMDELDNDEWYPSSFDKEYMDEYEYHRLIKQSVEKKKKLYFKNVILQWESCDCGDGYGCSHGNWVSEIIIKKQEDISESLINKLRHSNYSYKDKKKYWCFELEEDTYSSSVDDLDKNSQEQFCAPIPETLNDFINDCHRLGIRLEWGEIIEENIFKNENMNPKNEKSEQLTLF